MDWNFNMDEAPRGYSERRQRNGRDGSVVEYSYHVSEPIIAAGNGGTVTISRWLPEEGRWNMFKASVPPVAWTPWPKHPDNETPIRA